MMTIDEFLIWRENNLKNSLKCIKCQNVLDVNESSESANMQGRCEDCYYDELGTLLESSPSPHSIVRGC